MSDPFRGQKRMVQGGIEIKVCRLCAIKYVNNEKNIVKARVCKEYRAT